MKFFKKHKILTTFLVFLVFFVFYEVIPEIKGDKVYLITRLFHSHPELADQIVVKAFVLTDEQVGELFLHPYKEPETTIFNRMVGLWLPDGTPPPRLNLVFRVQNRGGGTMGTIEYDINDRLSGKFEVQSLAIVGGGEADFQNFVIPVNGIAFGLGQPKGSYPKITYKWREIYAAW